MASSALVHPRNHHQDIFEPTDLQKDHSLQSDPISDGTDVTLLADCVWFVNQLSITLQVQSASLVPHITLHTLIRYVIASGAREALVENDRYLVAAACFLIASKLTS